MLAQPNLLAAAALPALALGALLTACGGDGSGDPGTTAGEVGSDATGAGTVASGPGTSTTTTDETAGTSGAETTGSGTTGGGPPCATPNDCSPTQYCEFVDDSCGVSAVPGQCLERPSGCSADPRPVCGCDGQIHDGLCSASAAGQDVEFLATCTPPAGAFACGSSYCIGGEEYCLQIGGAMPTFECIKLAPVCGAGNCYCMMTCCGCENTTCCADHCDNSTGQTVITCPG